MGNCCATQTENEKRQELDYGEKQATTTGKLSQTNPNEVESATVIIQKYWKGVITRRAIKEQYGFESRGLSKGLVTSEEQVQAARKLVMQIHASLPPFDYTAAPPGYNPKQLKKKTLIVLENGAEYEGEWSKEDQKEGRGA